MLEATSYPSPQHPRTVSCRCTLRVDFKDSSHRSTVAGLGREGVDMSETPTTVV